MISYAIFDTTLIQMTKNQMYVNEVPHQNSILYMNYVYQMMSFR